MLCEACWLALATAVAQHASVGQDGAQRPSVLGHRLSAPSAYIAVCKHRRPLCSILTNTGVLSKSSGSLKVPRLASCVASRSSMAVYA